MIHFTLVAPHQRPRSTVTEGFLNCYAHSTVFHCSLIKKEIFFQLVTKSGTRPGTVG